MIVIEGTGDIVKVKAAFYMHSVEVQLSHTDPQIPARYSFRISESSLDRDGTL